LITDEISQDALDKYHVKYTNFGQLASDMDIEYFKCDPGYEKRIILGITSRQEIAKGLNISYPTKNIDEENIINISESAIISDRKRGSYWLDRIKNYLDKNILFICGSEHVKYFIKLVEDNKYLIEEIMIK
jgi:hypothetical protein